MMFLLCIPHDRCLLYIIIIMFLFGFRYAHAFRRRELDVLVGALVFFSLTVPDLGGSEKNFEVSAWSSAIFLLYPFSLPWRRIDLSTTGFESELRLLESGFIMDFSGEMISLLLRRDDLDRGTDVDDAVDVNAVFSVSFE
jgi:hypothetical protein